VKHPGPGSEVVTTASTRTDYGSFLRARYSALADLHDSTLSLCWYTMMLRIDEDRFPVFGRLIWRWRKCAPGNGRVVSAVFVTHVFVARLKGEDVPVHGPPVSDWPNGAGGEGSTR
jgi:hypothetical protein